MFGNTGAIDLPMRLDALFIQFAADGAIGVSAVSIAVALASLMHRRRDIAFGWPFAAFAVVVFLFGAAKLASIWTTVAAENASVLPNIVAALAAAMAAVAIWPLVARALLLPSAEHLRAANSALQAEIAERAGVEGLLRQAQKVEAVGQLTGGVAHDFNNALTVMSGNIELAAHALGTGSTERAERNLTAAMLGVTQAKVLTDRLLTFSRRRPSDARSTDVNALIGGLSDLLTRATGEAVEIRVALASGLGVVEVDRNQFEAALLHLATRARDAMANGDIAAGVMTIATANRHLDAREAHEHGVAPGDYVTISVSDTGAATPGKSSDPAAEQIAAVTGFAGAIGGTVSVERGAGAGTVVTLYLPRIDAVSAPGFAPTIDVRRAKGETVLVVEDDASVRAFVVESLRHIGYTVLDAADASDALALLGGDRRVDLLLTDVVMPRMSGRALAATARARQPGLRVLFMTGFARNAVGGRPGRDIAMISKPFTLVELAGKLREVLDTGMPALRRAG